MQEKIAVTGASGFIASHCILDLLQHGYSVRGTLRNLGRSEQVRDILAKYNKDAAEIEFAEANLISADGWAEAIDGCDGVFHVASPISATLPKDPNELIEPALQGTINVLTAAKRVGIKRVVLTSSISAVIGSEKAIDRTYTSNDWSDPQDSNLTAYSASKTIAEKKAWELAADEDLELAVINPTMVLGPALEADYGTSLELLYKLLAGAVPLVPKVGFEVVDVRDVSSLHRLAFEHPEAAGQRFLCAAGFRWFIKVADQLRREFPDYRRKIPTRQMPNALVKVFSVFIKELASISNELESTKRLDCNPALNIGWQPRTPEEAIQAGAKSLIELGLV